MVETGNRGCSFPARAKGFRVAGCPRPSVQEARWEGRHGASPQQLIELDEAPHSRPHLAGSLLRAVHIAVSLPGPCGTPARAAPTASSATWPLPAGGVGQVGGRVGAKQGKGRLVVETPPRLWSYKPMQHSGSLAAPDNATERRRRRTARQHALCRNHPGRAAGAAGPSSPSLRMLSSCGTSPRG